MAIVKFVDSFLMNFFFFFFKFSVNNWCNSLYVVIAKSLVAQLTALGVYNGEVWGLSPPPPLYLFNF